MDFTLRPEDEVRGSISPAEAQEGHRLSATDLTFTQIQRAIVERRWLVVACVALGVAAALAVSLLMTPLYRASVLLELQPPEVEILEDGSGSTQTPNQATFLQTQYGLLKSDSLAQRVARELNLAGDADFADAQAPIQERVRQAGEKLQAGLTIAPEAGSRLVRVYFTSPDKAQAARVVNAYADSFIKTNLERDYDASSYARSFLENQLAKVKGELEKSERSLNGFAQQSGIVTTRAIGDNGKAVDTGSLEDASLAALNTALTNARIARINAEKRYREEQQAGPGNTVVAGTSGLRLDRAKLQAEYDEKLRVYRPDYPEMQELHGRIEGLDRAIKQEVAQLSSGGVNTLRADYLAARQAEQELERRVSSLKQVVLAQRGESIDTNILTREVDTNRALYDALLQRYKEIGVTGGIGKSSVSLVDRARAPNSPFRPNIPLNLVVGLLLGTVLGLVMAVALELMFDTVKLPDDVRRRLRLRLLGVVPETEDGQAAAMALEDPKSGISEAYGSTRTALQFLRDGGSPQVVFLTSTRPGEGKSTSAYGLARSFARVGKRTLLIDADMRRPTFDGASSKSEASLAQLLRNDDALGAHVQPSGLENLSLLTAGRERGNPAELLASARLEAVVNEARRDYDVVIIDGPPVIGLADAPLLASLADATIVVIESGQTRVAAAVETLNRLSGSHANVAGGLLTKFSAKLADSDYYYYDYSYGKSGREEASRHISLGGDPRQAT